MYSAYYWLPNTILSMYPLTCDNPKPWKTCNIGNLVACNFENFNLQLENLNTCVRVAHTCWTRTKLLTSANFKTEIAILSLDLTKLQRERERAINHFNWQLTTADMILQIWFCRYDSGFCRYDSADMILQIWFCRYDSADMILQIWM